MASETARSDGDKARHIATTVQEAYYLFQDRFGGITRRAPRRFEARDWRGMQLDAIERLDLYPQVVIDTVERLQRDGLGASARGGWSQARQELSRLMAGSGSEELARSFFNSVSRRIFAVVGQDPDVEYTASVVPSAGVGGARVFRTYAPQGALAPVVRQILADCPIVVTCRDIEEDSRLAAERIEAEVVRRAGSPRIDGIDVLEPLFFRNKAAYLVGRVRAGTVLLPVIFALLHPPEGVVVDAVLTRRDSASILFSFTRSYFHVDVANHLETIAFLSSIMPAKRVAELYISIGYHKHGKTELYRDMRRHLERTRDRFELAPGKRGMVMLVFTLPSYDVVFKVIRDRFDAPKSTSRQGVMERYRFVFQHDRVGRLVDALEFEQLEFERDRFDEELLAALLAQAAETVSLRDDKVVFRHLYTERRVTPLDIVCSRAEPAVAREAVLDYGRAIKDLAAANIFPGDIFLKNFGVTRHGRVVFYDYDELALLTDCSFRRVPAPRTPEEELAAEPWFSVRDNDIFPEELPPFLGLSGEVREAFMREHADLFDVEFWWRMQEKHRAGELPDIFPYRPCERLRP